MTGVLIKRENLESGMHMGQHVNMKEEAWVMNVQAKQHQKLLADTTCRREAWERFFFTAFRRSQCAENLGLMFLDSRTVRQ